MPGSTSSPEPLEMCVVQRTRAKKGSGIKNEAKRSRLRRSKETPEERERRLAKNRESMRLRRQRESEKERMLRQQDSAIRMRELRLKETPEEARLRKAANATRQQAARNMQPRGSMSADPTQSAPDAFDVPTATEPSIPSGSQPPNDIPPSQMDFLQRTSTRNPTRRVRTEAERSRDRRAKETPEEREKRLARCRECMQRLRQRESGEERLRRQLESAIRMRELRLQEAALQQQQALLPQTEEQPNQVDLQCVKVEMPDSPEEEDYLGAVLIACTHCGSMFFQDEVHVNPNVNACCSKNNIVLEFSDFPIELRTLLTDNTPQAQNFRHNIRQYVTQTADNC